MKKLSKLFGKDSKGELSNKIPETIASHVSRQEKSIIIIQLKSCKRDQPKLY